VLAQYSAVGVGQPRDDEDAVALVRSADGASRYTIPPRHVPERGKVPEHKGEPSFDEQCGVLDDNPLGAPFPDESGKFTPKARTLAIEAATRSTKSADVLAREPAAVQLCAAEVRAARLLDIAKSPRRRPMPFEHVAAVRIVFNLTQHRAQARSF
jgi:hypothetical protein